MGDDGERLDTVESKLAFQEDALQQLSDALLAQQGRIDRLEAALRKLAGELQGLRDGAADQPDPPPPHY